MALGKIIKKAVEVTNRITGEIMTAFLHNATDKELAKFLNFYNRSKINGRKKYETRRLRTSDNF
jgi:hypothetical protein